MELERRLYGISFDDGDKIKIPSLINHEGLKEVGKKVKKGGRLNYISPEDPSNLQSLDWSLECRQDAHLSFGKMYKITAIGFSICCALIAGGLAASGASMQEAVAFGLITPTTFGVAYAYMRRITNLENLAINSMRSYISSRK